MNSGNDVIEIRKESPTFTRSTPGICPEPQISYAVELKDLGPNRVQIMRSTYNLGKFSLQEAADLCNDLPQSFEFANWTVAEIFYKTIIAHGAIAEFRTH